MARRRRQPIEDPPAPAPVWDTRDGPSGERTSATWPVRPSEAIGAVLLALSVITVLSLLSVNRGSLTDVWAGSVRRILGLGALPVTVLAGLGGAWLVAQRWHGRAIVWARLVWAEVVGFAALALLHLVGGGDPVERALGGEGGGLVGYALGWSLADVAGRWPSALLWLVVLLVALVGVSGQPPRVLLNYARRLLGEEIGEQGSRGAGEQGSRGAGEQGSGGAGERDEQKEEKADALAADSQSSILNPQSSSRRAPRKAKQTVTQTLPNGSDSVTPVLPTLPPLAMLERASAVRYREDEVRERSRIIEETLGAFGVPARVVSVNQGPTVTQYGIEPGYIERRAQDGTTERRKIKVSKILSLQNDLALALAAPSLRLEAPVPGRSVVGIEVPNANSSRVALRNLMESPQYQKVTSSLRLALGENVRGTPVVADLARMPHMLIAGATGSGKSVCINGIIACLLYNNTPDMLKLLMVDPKRVELVGFNGIPHLVAPVVVEMEEVVGALRWAIKEMDQRYQLFAAVGVRNLEGYNKKVAASVGNPLPYIVIIVDELADLMMVAAEEAERLICRLAQLARATGIHLILATQRPSTDVVTGLIKANFPARIAFAVSSQIDSRVILDSVGAEKLLGRGDMLFMAPDAPAPERLQGAHLTDRELDKLVKYWRRVAGPAAPPSEPSPWEGLLGGEDAADEKLIAEATTLVRQYRTASASFLQRRLRIGYPRAARLLDELEERGVIGPAEAGRSRPVLAEAEKMEAMRDNTVVKLDTDEEWVTDEPG